MQLDQIQAALREEGLDGWLFYDHHRRDPLAYDILGLPKSLSASRRWYYFIPSSGEPRGMVHRIEARHLDSLPGEKFPYGAWGEQRDTLRGLLDDARRIAMQHSPLCDIPYVAMVDAGTVDLVRSFGVQVESSANLVQRFHALLDEQQYQLHIETGKVMDSLRKQAFGLIADRLRSGAPVHEFEVHQFLRQGFEQHGLMTDHGPIVAVNANASDPHYEPSADRSAAIHKGDLVLIDMWAKATKAGGVYYDVTWVGYCGASPPEAMQNVFEVVKTARDKGFQLVKQRVEAGSPPMGFEVDDVVRGHIQLAGFGEYFVHRTGHSIGTDVHGTGANMDNLETHDTRRLMDGSLFSIEPGIYLPDFGIRSEFNVFVRNGSAEVTGEVQHEILQLAVDA
jgi:Xaa-Pro dipeptidase